MNTEHIACAIFALAIVMFSYSATAGNNFSQKHDFHVGAGLSIGGVLPIPMPVEIRSIEDYKPSTSCYFEGSMEHELSSVWALSGGLRLENRSMETVARVKGYQMEMVQDDDALVGYWTGTVSTTVSSWALSIPILAVYKIEWAKLKAGPYFSYMFDKGFSGTVYDGYLRNQTPIGLKTEIYADSPASYDFSDEIRTFHYGLQLGGEINLCKKINLAANVSMNLNSFFCNDFEVVTFKMRPLYINIGLAYQL